jgi:hypothetical protein
VVLIFTSSQSAFLLVEEMKLRRTIAVDLIWATGLHCLNIGYHVPGDFIRLLTLSNPNPSVDYLSHDMTYMPPDLVPKVGTFVNISLVLLNHLVLDPTVLSLTRFSSTCFDFNCPMATCRSNPTFSAFM